MVAPYRPKREPPAFASNKINGGNDNDDRNNPSHIVAGRHRRQRDDRNAVDSKRCGGISVQIRKQLPGRASAQYPRRGSDGTYQKGNQRPGGDPDLSEQPTRLRYGYVE